MGSFRKSVISFLAFSFVIFSCTAVFGAVPAIVGQDEGGIGNSPVSFNIGGESEMSQGHRVHVNVTTGNLVVKHTDLVIPTKGQDIVVSRTYNSLDLVNGIEKGLEVYVIDPESLTPEIHVSPGVAWVNGERVQMEEVQIWDVDIPGSNGDTETFYAYVRNLGDGNALIEFIEGLPPQDAGVDRYFLGYVKAHNGDEGDPNSASYVDFAVSFYTGLIHGAEIYSTQFGEDNYYFHVKEGFVAINGKKIPR